MITINSVKNIILFSNPTPNVLNKIEPLLFPNSLEQKIVAYMPSDGTATDINALYTPMWENLTLKYENSKFNFINNSLDTEQEKLKLRESNILIITGGNTFTLLNHLKNNGWDKEIINFVKKPNFVIAGFSAGAAILTPNINILKYKWSYGQDINYVNLTDLTALNIVNFEVLPHYVEEDKIQLEQYKKSITNEVKCIADDEFLLNLL